MSGPEENIPAWAIELIRQVERLNEKIPSHVEWATRNILDHEQRIREIEKFKWKSTAISSVITLALTLIATVSWNTFK